MGEGRPSRYLLSTAAALRGRRAQQRAGRGGDIGLPHQAFADQEASPCRLAAGARRSAGVKMPLSPTAMRSFGTQRRELSRWSRSEVSKRAQVAVVERRSGGDSKLQRAVELVARHGLRPAHPCPVRSAVSSSSFASRRRRQLAMMIEDAIGAPGACFHHLDRGRSMKSLRSTGSEAAARAAARNSGCPGTTARRSAPTGTPRRRPHRPGASGGGSKSARIRPFDGLAFLISAISAKSPARQCGSRVAWREAARRRRSIAWRRFELGERMRALGRGDLLALVGLDLLSECRPSGSPSLETATRLRSRRGGRARVDRLGARAPAAFLQVLRRDRRRSAPRPR